MNQILGQMSFNDIFAENVPIGSFVNITKVGTEIPFQKLKDCIGKKVVERIPTGLSDSFIYKVIMIKDYFVNSDIYYSREEKGSTALISRYLYSTFSEKEKSKMKFAFRCDQVAYTDDERTKKANSWLSEIYCQSGKNFAPHGSYSYNFYEYKAL